MPILDLMTLVADLPEGLVETEVDVIAINDYPNHDFGQICGSAIIEYGETRRYRAFLLTPDR